MKNATISATNHPDVWDENSIVEIQRTSLLRIAELICQEHRYPLLALRILIYVICLVDEDGTVNLSARRLSVALGVHYDTVSKSLKLLREMGVISADQRF